MGISQIWVWGQSQLGAREEVTHQPSKPSTIKYLRYLEPPPLVFLIVWRGKCATARVHLGLVLDCIGQCAQGPASEPRQCSAGPHPAAALPSAHPPSHLSVSPHDAHTAPCTLSSVLSCPHGHGQLTNDHSEPFT